MSSHHQEVLGDDEVDQVDRFLQSSPLGCALLFSVGIGVQIRLGKLKQHARLHPDKYVLQSKRLALISIGDPEFVPQAQTSGEFYCAICQETCDPSKWERHWNSAGHRMNQLLQHLRQDGGQQPGTREPMHIVVSKLDECYSCSIGEQVDQELHVHNEGPTPITLHSFNMLRQNPSFLLYAEDGTRAPGQPCVIQPGCSLTLSVFIRLQAYGVAMEVIFLDFGSLSVTRNVHAECRIEAPAGVNLEPSAPFNFKKKRRFQVLRPDFVPGEPPPQTITKWRNPPGQHKPPAWMANAFRDGRLETVEANIPCRVNDLTDYSHKMKLLLWAEELQHEIDVRMYDMEGVELHKDRSVYMSLSVPGLAENRPSVMRGDALYVRFADEGTGAREWQGFVHMVELEEVKLRFHPGFVQSWVKGRKVNVRFSISRSTFNFMQSAVARAPSVLHPCTVLGAARAALQPPAARQLPFLKRIASSVFGSNQASQPACITAEPCWTREMNHKQKEAVRAILDGGHSPMPYLIFGPPGTGKTMTISEAAAQVHKMDPASRILLTAPSNSASDLLALNALRRGVQPSLMLRACAYSRPERDLPEALHAVSNRGADGFQLPSLEEIKKKRVVVVTCLMAAKLYAQGVPTGHFTHIFVDEAGHAEEPLMLAAIAGLLSGDVSARLVMAGDPMQLGPIIMSPLAKKFGLDVSAMERLIKSAPYKRKNLNGDDDDDGEEEGFGPLEPHNPVYITKLVINYRSHYNILRLPNNLFYLGELECGADPHVANRLQGFAGLMNQPRVNARFPIIFHSINGSDKREATSPSWFNPQEALLIGEYVKELKGMRSNKPTSLDIGIISPYRKQVQRIRQVINDRELKVGSVEEFQGQERKAILISTVRSVDENVQHDVKHRLGFLNNPKRFNVAITRAKALLIVVGNPKVLSQDPCWAAFLQFVHRNGGWVGQPPPPSVAADSMVNGPAGSQAEAAWFDGLIGSALRQRLESRTGNAEDELAEHLSRLTMAAQTRHQAERDEEGDVLPVDVEGGEMPRWD
eukprot:gene6128-2734_t